MEKTFRTILLVLPLFALIVGCKHSNEYDMGTYGYDKVHGELKLLN